MARFLRALWGRSSHEAPGLAVRGQAGGPGAGRGDAGRTQAPPPSPACGFLSGAAARRLVLTAPFLLNLPPCAADGPRRSPPVPARSLRSRTVVCKLGLAGDARRFENPRKGQTVSLNVHTILLFLKVHLLHNM